MQEGTVMPCDLCRPHTDPDYKQIVEKSLALFAIYTGATLTFFVKDFLFSDKNLQAYHGLTWLTYWGSWCSLAVVALLLRYIVGSAAHLNHTYVAKTEVVGGATVTTAPRSNNLCLLFVDLVFLIVFGILAVLLTRSTGSLADLMLHAIYLVSAGFVWSLFALPRNAGTLVWHGWPKIPLVWLGLDGGQIVWTLFVLCVIPGELTQAVILGVTYLIMLFFDLYFVVRYMS
jgi:hypothetical protein